MSRRILFVEPIGGAAGDMLLAALIDAGVPVEVIRPAIEAVLPGRFLVDTEVVHRAGTRARLLTIGPVSSGGERRPPSRYRDLRSRLDAADLPPRVGEHARLVLERLAKAEAHVHWVPVDELVLHELGDDDTLLDVVGIAAALDHVDVDEVQVAPIPLGTPGPATLELLRGFPVTGAGDGETITPTAAAVFAALGSPTDRMPDMTIEGIGHGAGARDTAHGPNVVRVVLGTASAPDADESGRVFTVLEANLDDLTPELVADAAQALFAAGALDVWTVPVQMKKGRSGVILSALCERELEASLRAVFFRTTSTFGVRAHEVRREELERRVVTVPVADSVVRVKVGLLDGTVVTVTPEHDDVAQVAATLGVPVRSLYDEAVAAAQALGLASTGRGEG